MVRCINVFLQEYMRERDQETILLVDLNKCMLKVNPHERITMANALLHPCFTRQPVKMSWLGKPIDGTSRL